MISNEDILSVLAGMEIAINVSKLKTDVPLVIQGLDSLDVATLMFELESKYQKPLPPEKSARLRTIEQIVEYLNG